MPEAADDRDHITSYERAICYYALPKLVHPITYGIIVAYAVCLLEGFGAMLYGMVAGQPDWTWWGTIAFSGMVVFGVVVFMARSLLNDVRERLALAQARGVPDIPEAPGLPDPFAGHLLLRHPFYESGKLFACTENDATIRYLVDAAPGHGWWKISTPQDEEVCRVRAHGGALSFALDAAAPRRFTVFQGERQVAGIVRRFSLRGPYVDIATEDTPRRTWQVRQSAIYQDGQLAGRIYTLRHALYLDIRDDAFHEAVLGYFVTLT